MPENPYQSAAEANAAIDHMLKSCGLYQERLMTDGCDYTFDFRQPDLSAFPATDEERDLAARFTRIRFIVVDETPHAHTTWLVVDNQSFRLDGYHDTPEEASWNCWMLAKALKHALAAARGESNA